MADISDTTASLVLTSQALATAVATDPQWARLVADYRQRVAAWLEANDQEEAAHEVFRAACASLPPEPQAPSSWKGDISHRTIAQLEASCDSPAHKAAWAVYERERETWKAQREALRAEIVGAAKACHDDAYAAYEAALQALAMYRTSSAVDFAAKIEILAADYEGCQFPHEYLAEFIADARHLAEEARS